MVTSSEITQLLGDLTAGNRVVVDSLMPLVYDELRAIAHRHMQGERADHTLDTTALVHEAYFNTYIRAVSSDVWIPHAFRVHLGRCLTETRQYAEAERVLLASHESLGRTLGDTSGLARSARERLVTLYEAWGRPARAAEFRPSEDSSGR